MKQQHCSVYDEVIFPLFFLLSTFCFKGVSEGVIKISFSWTGFKWNIEYQHSSHLQECSSKKKGSFLIDSDRDNQGLKPLDKRLKGHFITEGSDSPPESKDQTLWVVWCDKIWMIESHLWSILTLPTMLKMNLIKPLHLTSTLKENLAGRGTS